MSLIQVRFNVCLWNFLGLSTSVSETLWVYTNVSGTLRV